MMFDNHTPINLESTREIACASTDGGSYDGIGYNTYTAVQGKRVHLYHRFSSGCEYNNRVDRSSQWLGVWDTPADLVAWLLTQPSAWWTNELLRDLGYEGEPA